MQNTRGFTLIELMVVVAIIGILASIALPAYQGYVTRAQVVEALTLVQELKPSVKDYYQHAGDFPVDNQAAGLPQATFLIGNYVTRIDVDNGALHVRLGNKITKALQGKTLTLRPMVVDGSPISPISWNCGYSTPPAGMSARGPDKTDIAQEYLPYSCR